MSAHDGESVGKVADAKKDVIVTLPSILEDFVEMLRTQVRQADFVTAVQFRRNAEAHIWNSLALIEATPEIEAAAEQAREACRTLAVRLASAESEIARHNALFAIEKLAKALETARPNGRAVHLGMGW